MLKIDNEIDNVLGLTVFYQYARSAVLNQQQTQHVSVFSTELFAHYLCIRCLSVTQCHQLIPTPLTDEMRRYQKCFYGSSAMYITDVLAFKPIRGPGYPGHFRKLMFVKDKTKSATSSQLDTSQLVDILKQSAVEHLTISRQLEEHKFGSVTAIVTTDYKALYAYKCGEYQRCLQLSTHNVRTLIGRPVSRVLSRGIYNKFAYPEFIQLMDDDIVSLTGLMLIVDPSCNEHQDHVSISQLCLSMYLMTQCQMKLHHSVTAQLLKYIEVASRRHQYQLSTLEQLLLDLTEQKILRYND